MTQLQYDRDCIHCGKAEADLEFPADVDVCSKNAPNGHVFDAPMGFGDPDCQKCGRTSGAEERANGLWLCDDCEIPDYVAALILAGIAWDTNPNSTFEQACELIPRFVTALEQWPI